MTGKGDLSTEYSDAKKARPVLGSDLSSLVHSSPVHGTESWLPACPVSVVLNVASRQAYQQKDVRFLFSLSLVLGRRVPLEGDWELRYTRFLDAENTSVGGTLGKAIFHSF